MIKSLHLDLHKLSNFVSLAIPFTAIAAFLCGVYISFYFHFISVALFFVFLVDLSYRKIQNRHTVLKNFGIMGQARYLIESIGPELRQYLFANDTEERPFNRQQRAEVYRKAKDIDSAASFGSMYNFNAEEIKVRHSMFPSSKAALKPFSVSVGEERGLNTAYTITRPIMISAMSYGALGSNAVRSLARGARLANIPMNTGEGGYPKYHLMEGSDLIFQLGTAKFGVRRDDGSLDDAKLQELAAKPEIKMLEIKLSQGAKPGKGGLLPKEKISEEIAELRGVSKDQDVISPPHHFECKDLSTTISFIKHVQDGSGLPTGIKLCVGSLDEFRALVGEMKKQDTFPDYISVDGSEGGTGAAPRAFLDRVGMPLLPALCGVNTILTEEGVRDRLKIFAAGKLIDPGSQMLAFALGADVIYSARGFMFALGCIQALQCGNNTCPVGITTHDPSLTKGLVIGEKALRVKNYVENIEHDLIELLAATGKHSLHELTLDNLYIPSQSSLGSMVREDPFTKPQANAVV